VPDVEPDFTVSRPRSAVSYGAGDDNVRGVTTGTGQRSAGCSLYPRILVIPGSRIVRRTTTGSGGAESDDRAVRRNVNLGEDDHEILKPSIVEVREVHHRH